MGLSPPPLQPLKSETEKRIRNGAKTLKEIDPEFYKWYKRQGRTRIFGTSCIFAAMIIIIVTAAIILSP